MPFQPLQLCTHSEAAASTDPTAEPAKRKAEVGPQTFHTTQGNVNKLLGIKAEPVASPADRWRAMLPKMSLRVDYIQAEVPEPSSHGGRMS